MEPSLKVEDHGDWLSFSMSHAGDASQGPDSLKAAYELDAEMIHARAADQIVPGQAYTAEHPLVLETKDF